MGPTLSSKPMLLSLAWCKSGLAKLLGLLRLVRLSNSLPAALLVFLGARLASLPADLPTIRRAAVAMWCITAFGYLSNDLFDRHEDQVNKPGRPLVTGVVTLMEATLLGALLCAAALWVSSTLGWLALSVALLVLSLLTLYNLRLKATAGGGNLLIGVLAGAALFSGAVAGRGLHWALFDTLLWPALTLTFFITAREVLKTLEDLPGDRLAGKATIAVAWGPKVTIWVLATLSMAVLLTSWLAWLWADYSASYLWLIQLGVNLPLWITVALLANAQRQGKLTVTLVKRLLWLLKGSYVMGLLALWWG